MSLKWRFISSIIYILGLIFLFKLKDNEVDTEPMGDVKDFFLDSLNLDKIILENK